MTRPLARRLRSAALTIGAVLGVVCALSVAAGLVRGIRPLVVQTGSMSPTIDAGALAWGRHVTADDLAVGDVVMVPKGDGDRVTHRIVAIEKTNTGTFVQLKGDANKAVDAQLYPVGDDTYRVFADVPYGGRVVAWLSGPIGLFLLGMYAMSLLFIAFRPRRDDGTPPSDDADRSQGAGGRRRGKRALRRTGASSVAAFAVVALTVAPSFATWTDVTSVLGSSLSTGSLVTPTLTCTKNSSSQVTISWTAASSPAAHGYTAVIVENGQNLTVSINGTQRSVVVTTSLLSTLFGQTSTVRVTGNLAGTNWTATPVDQKVTVAALGLDIACGTVPAAPTITGCTTTNGGSPYTLTWTWPGPGNPDSFQVVYSVNPGGLRSTTFAGTARSGNTVAINNETGNFKLVAVVGGIQSAASNQANYSGGGSGKSCTVVP